MEASNLYNKIHVFNENFHTNHGSCTRVDKRNIESYEHSVLNMPKSLYDEMGLSSSNE